MGSRLGRMSRAKRHESIQRVLKLGIASRRIDPYDSANTTTRLAGTAANGLPTDRHWGERNVAVRVRLASR
jgi:hypothetical protein